MALKLKEVFGVSKQRVQSYLERDAVDGFLVKALGSDNHIIVYGSSKQVQTRVTSGRAYPHRIPLARLQCMSEKRRSELAARLLPSRADSERYHLPPCLRPTSP